MISKTFEIRDEGTFIPALATKLVPACEADRYLLARSGYGLTPLSQASYVFVSMLSGGSGRGGSDPYDWDGGGRTMKIAHEFIRENFDQLESGEVIDVEFILRETGDRKTSERRSY